MQDSDSSRSLAALMHVRLLAIIFMAGGVWQGASALLEYSAELDRLYWTLFLRVRLAGPGLAVLTGLLLVWCARPLARWLTRP